MMLRNKFAITTVVLFLSIAVVTIAPFVYNSILQDYLVKQINETISDTAQQQKFNFSSKIEADVVKMKSLALLARSFPDDKETVRKIIDELAKQSGYEYIIIANQYGDALVNNGKTLSISNADYFKRDLLGETVISEPTNSVITDTRVISISTPIYKDNKITGVLVGAFKTDVLADVFLPAFDGMSFVYITDKNGEIIVNPENERELFVNRYGITNLFEGFNQSQFLTGYSSYDEMILNLDENISGCSKISINGIGEFVYYDKAGVSDWNIFVAVPEAYVSIAGNSVMSNSTWLALAIIITYFISIAYILFMQNMSDLEKTKHTAELEKVAFFDELTGLSNINKFKIDAGKILAANTGVPFVITKLDALNFKMINELYGFETGDKVIKAIADFFIEDKKNRSGITRGAIARVGSDEFVMLDIAPSDNVEIDALTIALEEEFNEKIHTVLGSYKVEFRYGKYFLDLGETVINDAIEKANIAHRITKTNKNTKICDYNDAFKKRIIRDVELENRASETLENKDFKVFLQPKYDINNETIVGAEALVRWQEKDGGLISPGEFIPLFERNGFIIKLDMYMFESACKIIRGWIDEKKPVVTISINFSRLHLQNSKFVSQLVLIAQKYNVPRKYIEIELTESVMYNNETALTKLLHDLHDVGFTLSMDDFGSGYSSLGLLKNLPVDVVKIDRSFFANNIYETRAKAVISSVMSMAKKLGIETVAEGVETGEHVDFLREVGCNMVQGYYYARPMPAENFFDDTPLNH